MSENYTVKETYRLPSEGKIYEKPINPEIELRSMTTREEMLRQSSTDRPYKLLADIIEGCIVNRKPEIKVYDMCIGDYEFLLHKIRVVTYGPEYKMVVQCPNCNNIENRSFNLDELEPVEFDAEEFEKLLTLELPRSGKRIKFKIQTPRILDDIELSIKQFKKRHKEVTFDPRTMITLRHSIDTVDGIKLTDDQLDTLITELPAKDTTSMLNRLDKLNGKVGLDTSMSYECGRCGFDSTTFFRFGPEFFRPSED